MSLDNDAIDKIRKENRRVRTTPRRFSVVLLSSKSGLFSVESVHGLPGLWDSLTVCEIDDITGQQCGDMCVVGISEVLSVKEW